MFELSTTCLARDALVAMPSIDPHESAEHAPPLPSSLVECAAGQQQSPREADAGLCVHGLECSLIEVPAEVAVDVSLVQVHARSLSYRG